jgi:hypothetical protein
LAKTLYGSGSASAELGAPAPAPPSTKKKKEGERRKEMVCCLYAEMHAAIAEYNAAFSHMPASAQVEQKLPIGDGSGEGGMQMLCLRTNRTSRRFYLWHDAHTHGRQRAQSDTITCSSTDTHSTASDHLSDHL